MPQEPFTKSDVYRGIVAWLMDYHGRTGDLHPSTLLRDDLRFSGPSLLELTHGINGLFFHSSRRVTYDAVSRCETIGDLVELIWRLLGLD